MNFQNQKVNIRASWRIFVSKNFVNFFNIISDAEELRSKKNAKL